MDHPRVATYQRRAGVDAEFGKIFERDLAGLVYIRLQKLYEQQEGDGKLRVKNFSVMNNVDKIGDFDDVVVRVEYVVNGVEKTKLILIQCKHLQNLANSKKRFIEYLFKKENLSKMFSSFQRIREILETNPTKRRKINETEEQANQDLRNLFQCEFQDCEFIFFTNIVAEDVLNDDSINKTYKLEEEETREVFDVTKCLINSDKAKVLEIDLGSKGLDFLKIKNVGNNLFDSGFSKIFRVFANQPSSLDLGKEMENYDCYMRDIANVTNMFVKELELIFKEPVATLVTASKSPNTVNTQQREIITENDKLIKKAIRFNELNKQSSKVIDELKENPILRKLFSEKSILSLQSKIDLESKINIATKFLKLEKFKLKQFVSGKREFLLFLETDDDIGNWLLARETFLYMKIPQVYICFECDSLGESVTKKTNEVFIYITELEQECESKSSLWDQFSEDAKKFVMNYKFRFQTRQEKIKLADLCGERCKEILDEDSICEILNGNFEIHQHLPEVGIYVPRSFQTLVCNDEIIAKLQKHKPHNSKFVVFSDNGQSLPGHNKESKLYFDDIDKAKQCIANFDNSLNQNTYHLCAYVENDLGLIYTIGEQRSYSKNKIIKEHELFRSETTKATILCDVAGMGKTTTMKYLAQSYKQNNPIHWVYFIQLNNFVDKIAKAEKFRDSMTTLNFLSSDLLGLRGVELKLFVDSCIRSGMVALFFDGFDEINPGAEKTFPSFLLSLQDSNIKTIFVSSRPSFVNILEKEFLQNSIQFKRFDTNEKRELLTLYWKLEMKNRKMLVDEKKLLSIVNIAITSLENEEHVLNEILETPLQIRMIAEGYFEHLLQLLEGIIEFTFNVSLSNLYEMFIVAHVKQYLEKSDANLNKFTSDYRQQLINANLTGIMELACYIILPKPLQTNVKLETFNTKRLLHLGLITNENPPVFLHRTIAEYLVAKHIISDVLSNHSDSETEDLINSIFLDEKFSVLRKFIDSHLRIETLPIYFAETEADDKSEETDENEENNVDEDSYDDENEENNVDEDSYDDENEENNVDEDSYDDENEENNVDEDSYDDEESYEDDSWTPLHIAAEEGNLNILKAFLNRDHTLLNIKNKKGQTALHCACWEKKMDVIQYLIKNTNCILNTVDNNNESVLHTASRNGILDVMKLILEPVEVVEKDPQQNPSTLESSNTRDVKYIDVTSCINMRNEDTYTPLYLAVKNRHIEAVKLLLKMHDCSVSLRYGLDKHTALHLAAKNGDTEIMELLIRQNNLVINVLSVFEDAPIDIAIQASFTEAVKLLVEYNCNINSNGLGRKTSALHIAAEYGNTDIISLLVEKNISLLNQPDCYGDTPLHIAVTERNIQSIISLLKHTEHDKSIINAKNSDGETPLHIACRKNYFDAIKLLISKPECTLDILDEYGNSIVHAACASKYATKETVSYILKHCDVPLNKGNKIGMTPFHLACYHFEASQGMKQFSDQAERLHSDSKTRVEILSFLLQLDRTQLNMKNRQGETPLHLACSVSNIHIFKFLLVVSEDDCSPYILDDNRNNIVHTACSSRTIATDFVKYLLDNYKQPINIKNELGFTPFHIACCRFNYPSDSEDHLDFINYNQTGKFHCQFPRDNIELLETLLQHDPSLLNMQTDKGETPLHIACYYGNIDAVEFLWSIKDCLVNKRDNFGNTAFHYAAFEKRSEIMELLWQHDKSQINRRNRDGNTALHLVCSKVDTEPEPYAISRRYIHSTAATRYYEDDDYDIYVFTESMKFILKQSMYQINKKNKLGRTPLHIVCNSYYGNIYLATMALLSNQHCCVTEQDNFGNTALHYAAYNDHIQTIFLLLLRDRSLLHMKNMRGKTSLQYAYMAGNIDTFLFLKNMDFSLNFRENICNSVIHYSAWKEQIDRMELLEKLGKIVFKQNEEKITNLTVTCFELKFGCNNTD